MRTMDAERWAQLENLYHAALERPADARSSYLDTACGGDAELRREVESLLAQDSASPLDRPAWEQAGGLLKEQPSQIGPYRILEKLGQGGMGEVYKAKDPRLKRMVAIKVLREGRYAGEKERLRFLQEARAASALNHPNIVQIYELETVDGADCIVMEFMPGQNLAQLLAAKPFTIGQALDYAGQIATALAAAHAAKIVHRDIKPANIVVTDSGVVKILDFGLAKLTAPVPVGDNTDTAAPVTQANTIMGTAAYMSPEQAEGKPVDARSDIFSTGATFYEMFTGKRAFDGDSALTVLSKVLRETPPPLRSVRPEIPKAVERIIDRCLGKDAQTRYASGEELSQALKSLRRPKVWGKTALAAVAGLVVATALAGWLYYRASQTRWVRTEALPQIRSLIDKADHPAAFDLTRTALSISPDDPDLKQVWTRVSTPLSVTTTPPGAQVSYRPYGDTRTPWKLVGTTPFEKATVPWDYLNLRIEKQGWEPLEIASLTFTLSGFNFKLTLAGQLPAGMVEIPEKAPFNGYPPNPPLPSFFLDKYEVTNRQFKKFLDGGGYRDAKNWRQPFRREGRELTFDQAMLLFRDGTGRPGPAGWQLGTFPKEQADYPVAGVSWYEAAAFCESAGKALPTVRHWRRAAGFNMFASILLFSNFANNGPAPAGANSGMTPFGAYDMAGNVKEWAWNAAGGRRAILGGGWNETSYMFQDADAQEPFTRGVSYGFRCAKYPVELPPALLGPMQREGRDYAREKPVDDRTFETFRRRYDYDRTPLDAKTEYRDEASEYWRKEKVSFRAVYGGERILGYLYLPKNAQPPFQTVIWAPGGYAHFLPSSEAGLKTEEFSFNYLLQTGRAIFHPVYKGTYDRRLAADAGENSRREAQVQYAKDLFQSVDYLESRPEIDRKRIGYHGLSSGTWNGIFPLAFETRVRAAVLSGGGLLAIPLPPEGDAFHYAPRVKMPVLMINGRYDFAYPLNESQKPLFRLLGTPEADKRHALFNGGHVVPQQETMREVLAWFDRYLGPVTLTR